MDYALFLWVLFGDILGHRGTHVDEEAGTVLFLINILLLEDCSSRGCHLDLYMASCAWLSCSIIYMSLPLLE
jgi:hypothetical protein